MADQRPTETTIGEARAFLNSGLYKGVKCPCCTQFAKIYKRQIHSTMSRMLIALFQLPMGYHHVSQIMPVHSTAGSDFALLRYWSLIEELQDKGIKDGRTTGFWKITSHGRSFVTNLIGLPKFAEIYNGRLIRLSGEDVRITDTLGNRFNYRELMAI